MKCKLLLSATLVSASLMASAQQQNTAYAITGKTDNKYFWADIKQIDVSTGKVVKTLFEADKTKFTTSFINKTDASIKVNPTAYGVAACAFDARHNRLYFAPMHFSDIYYLDLSSRDANFTVVKKSIIPTTSTSNYQTEENHITRMVFGADGYGYALTNDAKHLIRFTTDKNPVVEDLGQVTDAAENAISFHDKLSAWGGDMVADAFGKLVVVTARHNVFTIDVNNKTAAFTGTITGLPEYYTTNGAVVDNDGNLVVSTANVYDGLYTVNINDLKAVKIESTEKTFNASDLANNKFLSQKKYDDAKAGILPGGCIVDSKLSKVFPNPVLGTTFNVSFINQKEGAYNVLFTDLSGKLIQSVRVIVGKGDQTKTIALNKKPLKGFYFVKVTDANKKLIVSEKIIAN
ncbi:T9SS type A sorting domain-containing protein [Ferruginibacter lapsinanis]|uniref:T9SS type A sorting domain-containing protein n=1 Tax=Ferruginibacter lapsinanis TaxID=563172 RepID=UPI001E43B4E2|nr:T9SS type A sorting domain-containing protein [Ferruginibacter lapsinanis]UEG48771.1 T9SS type A sorting domain-containing protein [Ferruginibacter lapsinanis]